MDCPNMRLIGVSKADIQNEINELKNWYGNTENKTVRIVRDLPNYDTMTNLNPTSLGYTTLEELEKKIANNTIDNYINELYKPHFKKSEPKQSRNDLCACGSGKKYKRCCINKSKLK